MRLTHYLTEKTDPVLQAVKLFWCQKFYDINPMFDSRFNAKSKIYKLYKKEESKILLKLSVEQKKEYHKILNKFKKIQPDKIKKELEKLLGYNADNDPDDPMND